MLQSVRMDSALSSLLSKKSFAVDYSNVAKLISFCLVSALSSVDCERGFSRYNLIETYQELTLLFTNSAAHNMLFMLYAKMTKDLKILAKTWDIKTIISLPKVAKMAL